MINEQSTGIQQLESLLESSRNSDQHKHDHIAKPEQFRFDLDGTLIVPSDHFAAQMGWSTPPLMLTDHALRQICDRAGRTVFGKAANKSLPYRYLAAIEPSWRALLLNHHIRNHPVVEWGDQQKWMVRGYEDTVRAVLSDKYARVNNSDILERVHRLAADQVHTMPKLTTKGGTFLSPDKLHLKMIWKDIDTGTSNGNKSFGVGAYFGNDEIGKGSLRVQPMIQRNSCSNSIIIDAGAETQLVVRHVGSEAAKLVELNAIMGELMPVAIEAVDRMIVADGEAVPHFSATLDELVKARGWGQDTRDQVLIGTEGHKTRAGMVNGVTFAAQQIEDEDERIEMERLGGSILFGTSDLFSRAVSVAIRANR